MTLSIVETPAPLRTDADGNVRVGGTRVTLDTVVGAYLDGAIAEDIVDKFPTLELADVYAVLSYYLRHRADVDAYLREQEREAAVIRERIEAHSPQGGHPRPFVGAQAVPLALVARDHGATGQNS